MKKKEKFKHSLDREEYYMLDTILHNIRSTTYIYKNLFTRQIKKVSIDNINKNKIGKGTRNK